MEPPNFLFVFADQHRCFDLGCSGNAQVRSPAFDRFAAEGLRFSSCISNASLCVPARGNLLTGRHALGHGAVTNDLPIDTDIDSVAKALAREGYETAYFGKWHFGGVPQDQPIHAERRLRFREWAASNCDQSLLASCYYDADDRRHSIKGYDAEIYDGFVSWDELLRRHNLVDEWNRSQRFFGRESFPSSPSDLGNRVS
jgi:arylsulfatase A-like enzyme